VQGFGQRYEDANHVTLGQVSISGNSISRFITFSVPKASFGQPGPGWVFTVVLTGQDGFSNDQARGFQSLPQDVPVRGLRATLATRTAPFDPARCRRRWT
jgi:carbohydrate-binding DOMON domain-containing protein